MGNPIPSRLLSAPCRPGKSNVWEHTGVVIAICAVVLNILVTVIGGIWKLSRVELALRDAIDTSGREIDERIDEQGRRFGENIYAIREKIKEVELYIRDNYVQHESFYTVKDDLGSDIKQLGADLSKRLDRMEQIIINGRKD